MVGTTTYDFAGQSALVTGSTSGIGRGIAEALTEAGANVVINARTKSDVEETAATLDTAAEGRVVGVTADLSKATEIERLVDTTVAEFGTPDLLVNNAAVWPMEESMLDAQLDDWDHTMSVNVRAQFYATHLVARRMIEEGVEGCIVNVTSQTGDRRAGNRGIYGVSNTAINGLTWRLAGELAKHDIRVNSVSTDMTESRQLRKEACIEAESTGCTTDEVLREWGEDRSLGRLGRPEDLADAVLFLASDRAAYVVGTIIRVAGGGNLQ
jgi:NAD(P)-dependent dehydrogenase (short-subunit alcohol dehydrogenase family)